MLTDYRQCATCDRTIDFSAPPINDGVFQEHRLNGTWFPFCSDACYGNHMHAVTSK